VEELFRRKVWQWSELGHVAVSDETTKDTLRELAERSYMSKPPAATASRPETAVAEGAGAAVTPPASPLQRIAQVPAVIVCLKPCTIK